MSDGQSKGDLKAYAIERFEYQDIAILLFTTDWQGRRLTIGKPVEFVPYVPNTFVRQPSIELDGRAAHMLMDQLWKCGIRPKEAAGSTGALSATERHLADMRRLVFEEPKVGTRQVGS